MIKFKSPQREELWRTLMHVCDLLLDSEKIQNRARWYPKFHLSTVVQLSFQGNSFRYSC